MEELHPPKGDRECDHGEVPELVDPGCEGSLISRGNRLASTPELFLSHAQDSQQRTNMTVFQSSDAGEHWTAIHNVRHGPSAYSSLVSLSQSYVGLLWEAWDSGESDYNSIYFVALPAQ